MIKNSAAPWRRCARARTILLGAVAVSAALAPGIAGAKYVKFDPKGSVHTHVESINATGEIAGYWQDGNGTHGFVRGADGTISAFDVPHSAYGTYAMSINDGGTIIGYYGDDIGNEPGFVRMPKGKLTSYAAVVDRGATGLTAINAKTLFTGSYLASSGIA